MTRLVPGHKGRANVTDVLTREECAAVGKKLFSMVPAGMTASVDIASGVAVTTEFARGEPHIATETSTSVVSLRVFADDRKGAADGTRLDDEGLKQIVDEAVTASQAWRGTPTRSELRGAQQYKTPPKLYFDGNLRLMTPDGRGALIAATFDAFEAAELVGSGRIWFYRNMRSNANTAGLFSYSSMTTSGLTVTARTRDGTGSGWAWAGYEDWSRIDAKRVIARAIDLAERSRNPVAVEPGRYTVILEPPAVAALLPIIPWDAWWADQGQTVFSKDPIGSNKIGLQMIDRRLNIVSDPWDTEAPQPTADAWGYPLDKVQWFQDGILKNLIYPPSYAKEKNRDVTMSSDALRVYGTGPTQTLEEMIASTKRGIWVNRLSSVVAMNFKTCLVSGTTRDGTFLIENGKITKPIKNLRFMESPFFVFNRVEAFGDPVRSAELAVTPRVKARDFEFTSMTDAV